MLDLATPSAGDNLPGLVANLPSNAIKTFEREISGKWVARAEKGFIFIHFERRFEWKY